MNNNAEDDEWDSGSEIDDGEGDGDLPQEANGDLPQHHEHEDMNVDLQLQNFPGHVVVPFITPVANGQDIMAHIIAVPHIGQARRIYVVSAVGSLSAVTLAFEAQPDMPLVGVHRITHLTGSYMAGDGFLIEDGIFTVRVLSPAGALFEGMVAQAPMIAHGLVWVFMATTVLDFQLVPVD